MEIIGNQKSSQKMTQKFICELCDYFTCKKSNFIKHLSTDKHKKAKNGNQKVAKVAKVAENLINNYICEFCNQYYNTNSGLWKHNKKCNKNPNNIIENNSIITESNNNSNEFTDKDLITMLLKQNAILIEQNNCLVKNGTSNIQNINNNSHNKTFNLNMFLNETCKNAMNISDFAESIQLQLSDLESVGELGYVNGISNIIIKNLKELDITQRPIHCTDAKREILYIKDRDKWEKEGEQKEIIVKFVNNVANKNIKMLNEFKKKYPDCCKYESKYSDYYSKLIIEAMGGSGGTNEDKNDKIIKKITREVTIDKSFL
jgi:hypothetical protein